MNSFKARIPSIQTQEGDNILFPFSPPLFQTEVSDEFTDALLNKGREIDKKSDNRASLAGSFKNGISLRYPEDDFFIQCQNEILKYVDRYFKTLKNYYQESTVIDRMITSIKKDRLQSYKKYILLLDTLWINFQKKHDYNPLHNHDGALSFVIYCKVPSNLDEEQPISNTKQAGKIVFSYGEYMDLTTSDITITPYKNLMFIFPSKLKHTVPAYWVDEERISVSGNIIIIGK